MLVGALLFIAVAPTLAWMEFSNGSEVLNVQTVLELRRGAPWLVPPMQGEPRVAKPPLTAWLTAAAVSPESVAALSNTDPAARELAYRKVAWEIRWPALLATCFAVMAVYGLGRALGGETIGLVAALVCATCFLVLRLGRYATTDIQLFLWVSVANLFIARALIRGERWRGCLLAGAALGLAFMSKGPVALLQTVAPALVFVVWDRWAARRRGIESMVVREPGSARWWGPVLAGAAVLLVVGFSWFGWMLINIPDIAQVWWMEVTRDGATDLPPDRWFKYIELMVWVFPWTAFFIVGIVVAARAMRAKDAGDNADPEAFARTRGAVFALLLVVVPLVVMSFVSDRKDRYALPTLGGAAVVIAYGLAEHFRSWRNWNKTDTVLAGIQWFAIAVLGIGLPLILSPIGSRLVDLDPVFSTSTGVALIVGMTVLVAAGVLLHRRWPGGIVAGTVAVMLAVQAIGFRAYGVHPDGGQSDVKPVADAIWASLPDAEVRYIHTNRRVPEGVSIYLNRNVPRVEDPSTIPPTTRPMIALVTEQRCAPEPTAPPGWEPFSTGIQGRKKLHAFVRTPTSVASP